MSPQIPLCAALIKNGIVSKNKNVTVLILFSNLTITFSLKTILMNTY